MHCIPSCLRILSCSAIFNSNSIYIEECTQVPCCLLLVSHSPKRSGEELSLFLKQRVSLAVEQQSWWSSIVRIRHCRGRWTMGLPQPWTARVHIQHCTCRRRPFTPESFSESFTVADRKQSRCDWMSFQVSIMKKILQIYKEIIAPSGALCFTPPGCPS